MAITVSGTTITFNDATTQSTAGAPGTVTSVATGNGLSGGTITTSGTLIIACPTQQSIGAYGSQISVGGVYSVGSTYSNPGGIGAGTWRCMGQSNDIGVTCPPKYVYLFCRVS